MPLFNTNITKRLSDAFTGNTEAKRAAAAKQQELNEKMAARFREEANNKEAEIQRQKEAMPRGDYQKGSDTYSVRYIVRVLSAAAAANPGIVIDDKDQVYENYISGSIKMEDKQAKKTIEEYNNNRKRLNNVPIELENRDPEVKSLINAWPTWALPPKYPGGVYMHNLNGRRDNIWIRYEVTNTSNRNKFEMDENEIGSIVSPAPEITDGVYYTETEDGTKLEKVYWVRDTATTPGKYDVDNISISDNTKDAFVMESAQLRGTLTAHKFRRMEAAEANRLIEEYKKRIAATTSSETVPGKPAAAAGGKGKKRRSTRRSKNSRRCTVKRRKPRLVRQKRH
jgi:hypothetical protein